VAIASIANISVHLKKRYTSILTLACTAVITSDLASVSAWIVYEQWISPIIHPRSRPTKSEKDKARELSEATQIHPYGKQLQSDSSSDLSYSSTLTNILPVITRAQMFGSGIRSGIQSLSTTLDGVMQNQTHDLERVMPVRIQQTSRDSTDQPPISLRSMATVAHVATKMFRQGIARTAQMSPEGAPHTISRTSRTAASPSNLVFPDQPQQILERLSGEVRDLEYSHEGLVLAVAR